MARHGKQFVDTRRKFDQGQLYPVSEAVELVKRLSTERFDASVDIAFKLGVDPRKADQMLRSTVSLPNGTGKDVTVAVFAAGEKAQEAEEAGADFVGTTDLVAKVQAGDFTGWDIVIATPDLMGEVGKLGRILGPRGLMPNPKAGTVTNDVARTVREFKAGRSEYRTDRYGNVHLVVGKVSFETPQLAENILAVFDELHRVKPAAAKGRYMKAVTVSSTMGPGISIDPVRPKALED